MCVAVVGMRSSVLNVASVRVVVNEVLNWVPVKEPDNVDPGNMETDDICVLVRKPDLCTVCGVEPSLADDIPDSSVSSAVWEGESGGSAGMVDP